MTDRRPSYVTGSGRQRSAAGIRGPLVVDDRSVRGSVTANVITDRAVIDIAPSRANFLVA